MLLKIRVERKEYYGILETTQKETTNITKWLTWFLGYLEKSLLSSDEIVKKVQMYDRQISMMNKLVDGFLNT